MSVGTSIDRFLLTVSTFSRELNTARKLNEVFSAINNVLKRFFEISSTALAIKKADIWEMDFSESDFPISKEDLHTYIDLSSERKAHSFYPIEEGILLILPSLKSGQLLTVFFALIPQDEEEIRQEYDSILNFISFFSGIVIENLQLYHEVVDQSAMQEALKKYFLTILDSIDEAIMVWNKDLELSFVNQSYRQMDPPESVLDILKEIVQQTFEQKSGIPTEKEIDQAFYSINSVWMEAEQEVLIRMEDITRTKELERLKRIDQMKTEFISNISHELRTPLAAVKAYSETINDSLDSMDTDTLREFMGTVLEQSSHLEFLLDQLLDFSKLESHSLQMELHVQPLKPLLNQLSNTFKMEESKGVRFSLEAPSDEMQVEIDAKRMTQVFNNIVQNAIKYRNPDHETVDIQVAVTADEQTVTISFADNGIGIPEDSLSKIFDKFYRVDSSLTYSVDGTGLGLTICKEIVEGHQGRMWVESVLGEGSTFFVQIPLKVDNNHGDGTSEDT